MSLLSSSSGTFGRNAPPVNLPSSLSLPQLSLGSRRDSNHAKVAASAPVQSQPMPQSAISTISGALPSIRSFRNRFSFAKAHSSSPSLKTRFLPFTRNNSAPDAVHAGRKSMGDALIDARSADAPIISIGPTSSGLSVLPTRHSADSLIVSSQSPHLTLHDQFPSSPFLKPQDFCAVGVSTLQEESSVDEVERQMLTESSPRSERIPTPVPQVALSVPAIRAPSPMFLNTPTVLSPMDDRQLGKLARELRQEVEGGALFRPSSALSYTRSRSITPASQRQVPLPSNASPATVQKWNLNEIKHTVTRMKQLLEDRDRINKQPEEEGNGNSSSTLSAMDTSGDSEGVNRRLDNDRVESLLEKEFGEDWLRAMILGSAKPDVGQRSGAEGGNKSVDAGEERVSLDLAALDPDLAALLTVPNQHHTPSPTSPTSSRSPSSPAFRASTTLSKRVRTPSPTRLTKPADKAEHSSGRPRSTTLKEPPSFVLSPPLTRSSTERGRARGRKSIEEEERGGSRLDNLLPAEGGHRKSSLAVASSSRPPPALDQESPVEENSYAGRGENGETKILSRLLRPNALSRPSSSRSSPGPNPDSNVTKRRSHLRPTLSTLDPLRYLSKDYSQTDYPGESGGSSPSGSHHSASPSPSRPFSSLSTYSNAIKIKKSPRPAVDRLFRPRTATPSNKTLTARDRSASLDLDRSNIGIGDWTSSSNSKEWTRPSGEWPASSRPSVDWLGPRTARAFAAAGIDVDSGARPIGNKPGSINTWRSSSDFRSMTPVSASASVGRMGTESYAANTGSWGRRGGSGSVRGGGGPGTDLSSPSTRTAFSTNSNSNNSSSATSQGQHAAAQQFQEALQSMKERHDLEKEALLSALAESKRTNNDLRMENDELGRENDALKRRIRELECYIDEVEDKWSEALFRNRMTTEKEFQVFPFHKVPPLQRLDVPSSTPATLSREGSASGIGLASTPDPKKGRQQHRRQNSATSSIFPHMPGSMSMLLQETPGMSHDHQDSADSLSLPSDSPPPSPTMIVGSSRALSTSTSRLTPRHGASILTHDINKSSVSLTTLEGSPPQADSSFLSSAGTPGSPQGSLMLRPEDERHLVDLISLGVGGGAESD